MFHHVDRVMQKILTDELAGQLGNGKISFQTPDASFAPDGLCINCFLYDARENSELRSNEWQFEKLPDGTAVRVPPPAWVDCRYLISVWADDVETEHRMLGEVMKSLLAYRKPAEELASRNISNKGDVSPAITLANTSIEYKFQVWQALAMKPRPILDYQVSVCVDVLTPENYPIVEEKVLDIRPLKEIVTNK